MEKNKKLFLLFMILCVAAVLINFIRSIVIVAGNFEYIVNAPNFKLNDILSFFLSSCISGVVGILLFIGAIALFAISVIFAIRYLRDSGALDYIKNEIKQFINSFKKSKDKQEQTTDQNKKIQEE